jgi:uncharacterized protein (DUF885 family)
MDTPGAYETRATEAYYYVTPSEKDWDANHKREHLRLFNRPVMDMITIHEAFPGHFTQFIYSRQFPTMTRKLVYCASSVEGWARYAEQMMLEEGFGGGNLRLKLAQLSEALLRDYRYVAGIKLHAQGMSVEDATALFVDHVFQERAAVITAQLAFTTLWASCSFTGCAPISSAPAARTSVSRSSMTSSCGGAASRSGSWAESC